MPARIRPALWLLPFALAAQAPPEVSITHGPLPAGWMDQQANDSRLAHFSRRTDRTEALPEIHLAVTVRWVPADVKDYAQFCQPGERTVSRPGLPPMTVNTISGNPAASFDGRPAWRCQERVSFPHYLILRYWVEAGNGRRLEFSASATSWASDEQMAPYFQEAVAFLETFRFSHGSGPTGPGSAEDSPEWLVIAGLGLAVVAAAAVAVRLMRGSRRNAAGRPAPAQNPNSPAGYVVQLSSDNITLDVGQPVALQAWVWAVHPVEGYRPAQEAALRIVAPPGFEYLTVMPATGAGTLAFQVLLTRPPTAGAAVIDVVATAPGGGTTARIRVNFGLQFRVLVEGKPKAAVRFNREKRCWVVPDAVAGFWPAAGNAPAKPDFQYDFPTPQFEADPAILQLDRIDPGGNGVTHLFRFSLKPGVNPVDEFGADSDGCIHVTVTALDDQRRKHVAVVIYQITPQLRIAAYTREANSSRPGQRVYDDIQLGPREFVVDGQDILPLAVCFVRTDEDIPEGEEYLHADEAAEIKKIDWAASSSFLKPPAPCRQATGEGIFAYDVGSGELVKPTKEVVSRKYALRVTPKLREGVPPNLEFEQKEFEVPVKLQFLRLKLYVVPGARGSSDAYAYAGLFPLRAPYPGRTLRLSVSGQSGGPSLSLGCPSEQVTASDTPEKVSGGREPLIARGCARWTLRYSGLTWDNLGDAVFQVVCELPGRNGSAGFSVTETVNVGENVRKLLGDLAGDSSLAVSINNPYWDGAWCPAAVRGPCWNLIQLFQSGPFVCSNMRDAILRWLEARQLFNPNWDPEPEIQLMRGMNGIEFDYYNMIPWHVWAGIFLSGNDRNGDYRAIDPWWTQEWKDASYREVKGLMTKQGERNRVVASLALAAVMATVVVGGVAALATRSAATLPAALAALRAWMTGESIKGILVRFGAAAAYDRAATFNVADYTDKNDGRAAMYSGDWFLHYVESLERWRKTTEDL